VNEDRFIPFAINPWDEIIPNLWMGGMYYSSSMIPCVPEDQFDVVISMAGKGGLGTRVTYPGVLVHSFFIDDGILGPGELELVQEAVDLVMGHMVQGRKVLVRCQMGYNRSGLVVALVLRKLSHCTPAEIVDLIRERRSQWALCNEWFVKLIEDR
jgi:dual specificity protein phosphatase-like protein